MKMPEDEGEEFELSSGRRFQANRGIIGLEVGGDRCVFGGYDSPLTMLDSAGLKFWPDDGKALSIEERAEIASFMIEEWRMWGEGL